MSQRKENNRGIKEQRPKALLASISGQKVFEILAQLRSDDSIQILLNLIQLIRLGTESNLEGLVWSH